MPFRSKAQQRYMHAVHPGIARRWDALTDFKHLPERSGGRTVAKKPNFGSKSSGALGPAGVSGPRSAVHAALDRMSKSAQPSPKARLREMVIRRVQVKGPAGPLGPGPFKRPR